MLELPSIFHGSEPTWKVVMETHLPHQPKDQLKDLLKPLEAVLTAGLVITTVMIKTMLLNANMMEVIAVETMLIPHTALLVNVWNKLPPPQLKNPLVAPMEQVEVVLIVGLETITVMI